MADWNDILVERLRYLINDLDSENYTYTDLQLEKFLTVSATLVLHDILPSYASSFSVTYTINTNLSGTDMISPDPVINGPHGFVNLILIKSACLIANAELKKTGAEGGWKIIDDRSTIDGTKAVEAAKDTQKTFCAGYAEALKEFKNGNRFAGWAILSPYSSPNNTRYTYGQG